MWARHWLHHHSAYRSSFIHPASQLASQALLPTIAPWDCRWEEKTDLSQILRLCTYGWKEVKKERKREPTRLCSIQSLIATVLGWVIWLISFTSGVTAQLQMPGFLLPHISHSFQTKWLSSPKWNYYISIYKKAPSKSKVNCWSILVAEVRTDTELSIILQPK